MPDNQRTCETQFEMIQGGANRRDQVGKADNGLPVRRSKPVLGEKASPRGQAGASLCSANQAKRFPFSKQVIMRLIDWLEKE